ncbi:hypothetical protein HMPREF1624_03068 [Sporothrix schenckii ATCC 58251]|uniref:Uncharacterized protein n=1 Tax=Sporothrix schenckii (strain ATCC 58251 / de Perez 2211183) TaxID=1391915 RepID=U7PY83_SPOS1|nr:hypothetical protein HMPREF1624_03068 [Sporothrix schenckii ATCC 58251]
MAAATLTPGAQQQSTHNQMPAAPRRLQRDEASVLCPVTALAFYRFRQNASSKESPSLFVLAGEDGWLAVYGALEGDTRLAPGSDSLSGRRCYGRLRVFSEQPIQGCRVGRRDGEDGVDEDDAVLVWGGRSVAIVGREHIAQILAATAGSKAAGEAGPLHPVVNEVLAPDWIYDGLLPRCRASKGLDGRHAGALVTAHNEILPLWVEQSGLIRFGAPISPSRPVLYSAQLAWAGSNKSTVSSGGDERLLVVAGTVFGEIVVWTCQLPTTDNVRQTDLGIDVLDVFTGHEGSIFDVIVSPELRMSDLVGREAEHPPQRRVRLLASCSDDRTICIWPLYLDSGRDEADGGAKVVGASATNMARETGFQNTFDGLARRTDEPPNSAKPQPRTAVEKQYLQSADLPAPSTPSSSSALASVMAHASRIWHVRFAEFSPAAAKNGNLLLYSFGEDATAQEWRLELGLNPRTQDKPSFSGKLVHLRTLSSHVGKNIWSAAVFPKAYHGVRLPRGPLIATGGCDGKICLFEGRHSEPQPVASQGTQLATLLSGTIASSKIPSRVGSVDTEVHPQPSPPPPPPATQEEEGESVPKKKSKAKTMKIREELFNSYAFLSDDQLLAATTQGRLLRGDLRYTSSEAARLEWIELPGVSDDATLSLKDYNVVRSPLGDGGSGVATNPSADGLAIIGNATGHLFLYSRRGGLQRLTATIPGKVDEIFFLPHTADDISAVKAAGGSLFYLGVIATTLFRDEATLLVLTIDVSSGALVSESTRSMKLPTKVPASPAAMVITTASRCLEYIVLGSRNGQLCLYKPVESDGGNAAATFVLATQFQTRTRDAILSIVPLPPRPGQPPLSSASFVVTARDGMYRICTIVESSTGNPSICLQHETATPFGPIVRDAWFIQSETPDEPPELVVCGFRSTHFVVWNETRQQELAAVDCGGTHRTHTYLYGRANGTKSTMSAGRIRFAFTRQSELHVFAQDVCVTVPLKTGGHGREIRSVCASASGKYIATGGEDTVVRIWNNPQTGGNSVATSSSAMERRCLSVLKLHNTGLHSLAWLGDDCLISAAGSEELFIWRVSTMADSSYDGLAVLCESSYPDSKDDKILRIIGLDASLDPSDNDGSAMFISVALSNSVLKTYRYAAASGWQLLSQGHYTGACPTQLRHLSLRRGGDLVVLAAFADGHLTVWRAAPEAQEAAGGHESILYGDYLLLCLTRTHQSAVKSLDLVSTGQDDTGSRTAILTGGDDNAIAVTILGATVHGDNSVTYAFDKTFRVPSAHAAAVTGAKILINEAWGETGNSSFTAVTCSNDQRLKAWRVIMSNPGSASAASTASTARIQLLDDRYSAIADPGDVESIGGDGSASGSISALLVGMGMETWRLEYL